MANIIIYFALYLIVLENSEQLDLGTNKITKTDVKKSYLPKNILRADLFKTYEKEDVEKANKIAVDVGFDDFEEYATDNPDKSINDYAKLKGFDKFSDTYETYQITYDRKYSKSESPLRQIQLLASLKNIKDTNELELSFEFGETSLSDETDEEYYGRLGAEIPEEEKDDNSVNENSKHDRKKRGIGQVGKRVALPTTKLPRRTTTTTLPTTTFADNTMSPDGTLPTNFDWRAKGVVYQVEDQGRCMSCWAFSTTSAIESHYAIKYGKEKLRRLSPQQLLDCVNEKGCEKGFWPNNAMTILLNKTSGFVASGQSYPYSLPPKQGTCHSTEDKPMKITGFVQLPKLLPDIEVQRTLYEKGPLIIVMKMDPFKNYKKGVVYDRAECIQNGTHAITLIGWGTDTALNKSYWTIKNSFGPKWGEDGYIRVERKENICLIKNFISYPVID